MYDTNRLPGREHIPSYPKGFIVLRVLQLVFSVLLIGISAASIWELVFAGNCLMLSTGVLSLASTGYLILAQTKLPNLYHSWTTLSIDIFLLMATITSVVLLAIEAAAVASLGSFYCDGYICHWGGSNVEDAEVVYFSLMATAVGLGVLQTIFFLFSLLIHSKAMSAHRKAGFPSRPPRAETETESAWKSLPPTTYPPTAKTVSYVPVPTRTACPYRNSSDGGPRSAPWALKTISPGDHSAYRESWPVSHERAGLMG